MKPSRDLMWAIGGLVLTLVFTVLLLQAESQWLQLGLIAAAAVLIVLAARSGIAARAEHACTQRPRLMNPLVLLAFIVLLFIFREEHFTLLVLSTILLYAVVCLGLNIQIGYGGVMNFAAAAFFGIGSYTAAVLSTHTALPHLLILPIGGLMAALIGSVLLLPVLRTRGHYASLVTIAFGILFRSFLEVNETLGGPQGLKIPGMTIFGWELHKGIEIGDTTLSFYLNYASVALVMLILAFTITRRLERSWIGLSFDAIRIDETSASTFGISIPRWRILSFSIGNFFAGCAGALFAMMTAFVAPTNFNFGDSLILLSILVIGGIGNPWGVLPAAAIVVLLPEKLQAIQEYRFLLYAIAVILVLMFRTEGLFPRRLRQYFPGAGR
jgi:ABC-type branched-subunit amino acid transport system permease subunit